MMIIQENQPKFKEHFKQSTKEEKGKEKNWK